MRHSTIGLALALQLLGASTASAQTLGGQIIHLDTKLPAGNALVSLFDDSTRVAASIRTDSATGMFYLDAPHPGRYRVVINLPNGAAYLAGVERFDSTETHEKQYSLPPLVVPTKDTVGLYFATEVDSIAYPHGREDVPRLDLVRWHGRAPESAEVTFVVVVDSSGVPEMDSYQTLAATDPGLADAMKRSMAKWRFSPAQKDGHHVRMIWQSGIIITRLGMLRSRSITPPSPIGTATEKVRVDRPGPRQVPLVPPLQ